MKVMVTGSQGFIARNLIVRLRELKSFEIIEFHRGLADREISDLVAGADFIFHLAGVNRPKEEFEFRSGNVDLTNLILNAIKASGRSIPIVFSSSIQATKDNPYGRSKKDAEDALMDFAGHNPVFIYRLPNVFGKWSKPNYNSAVATFCHNIANDFPIQINDPEALVSLVYIDDVVSSFIDLMLKHSNKLNTPVDTLQTVEPVYNVKVGWLVEQITQFKTSRQTLVTEDVGGGLVRALHATYLSFLKPENFSYKLPRYEDPRGVFVEMLKTKSAGQFSFFTAHPGITRGGHYHHSKTEKFLVIKGKARYRFRNIMTGEIYEIFTDSSDATVVETVPGWSHNITNVGTEELIVMLWANEIFDRTKPDTIGHEV